MKYSQKSHSGDRNHNMTVVLFTLLCVLIYGSLALSPKAQTKTSDEHVTPNIVPGRNGIVAFRVVTALTQSTRWRRTQYADATHHNPDTIIAEVVARRHEDRFPQKQRSNMTST